MSQKKEKKGIGVVTFMYLLLSVVYILIGLAGIMLEGFSDRYIVITAGFILLIIGILLIVQYFVSHSFQDIGKYGFSMGVLAVLGGAIVLIRSANIADMIGTFLGFCILLTAVIKLQNAVDMKSLEHAGWVVFLIIAAAFIISSILIILNPGNLITDPINIVYYIMIADGAVNLFSTLYLTFVIRAAKKHKAVPAVETPKHTVPFAHTETEAERISEDDVEVIIPGSGEKASEASKSTEHSSGKEEKTSLLKKIIPGLQDKNS